MRGVGYRFDNTLQKSIIGLGSTYILVFVVVSGGYQGTALIIRYYQAGTSFSNVFLVIHEEKRHVRLIILFWLEKAIFQNDNIFVKVPF